MPLGAVMKTPVAFALLALLSGPLEAKTLKLATREWAPYASRSITNGGIATSVVEFIVEKMQGTLSYQVLPGKRAIAEAESGADDG
jgi:polar amino acid transport system substrate-binding protein